jgi:hypothetical protein
MGLSAAALSVVSYLEFKQSMRIVGGPEAKPSRSHEDSSWHPNFAITNPSLERHAMNAN